MKYYKILVAAVMVMTLTACGNGKTQEEPEVQVEEAAQDDTESYKKRAYEIGKESADIIDAYGSGQMSQEIAAKLLKANYEELAELKDYEGYSEYDSSSIYGLWANSLQAFNDLFDDQMNLVDDLLYLEKCLDRLEKGESEE